jgi:hypothetical protein
MLLSWLYLHDKTVDAGMRSCLALVGCGGVQFMVLQLRVTNLYASGYDSESRWGTHLSTIDKRSETAVDPSKRTYFIPKSCT